MHRPKLPRADRTATGVFVQLDLRDHPPIPGHDSEPESMVIEVARDARGVEQLVVEISDRDGEVYDYDGDLLRDLPAALRAVIDANRPAADA